jgi:hypothetical protein
MFLATCWPLCRASYATPGKGSPLLGLGDQIADHEHLGPIGHGQIFFDPDTPDAHQDEP